MNTIVVHEKGKFSRSKAAVKSLALDKEKMSSAPALKIPNFDKILEVESGASYVRFDVVLSKGSI